jgi:hypothetical protein
MELRSVPAFSLILLPSLMIFGLCGSIYGHNGGNSERNSPLAFTEGEDTSTCGGIISADCVHARFTGIPLAVESDAVITQLINITNTDSSDHDARISVVAEDFGIELSSLKIYLVSPTGAQTLVTELDNSGNVILENVQVSIARGQEWAIKLVGHYDSGTPKSQRNSFALCFQVV